MDLIRPAITHGEIFRSRTFFTGHVQGVGFRYQTLQIAKEFELSGFVGNLADGRVQLEAEGQEQEVRSFMAEVSDCLSAYIRKTESSEEWGKPLYKGFTISY